MRVFHVVLLCALLVSLGCGVESAREASRSQVSSAPMAGREMAEAADRMAQQTPQLANAGELPIAVQERKIIFTADVSLVVTDFSKAEKSLPKLVREYGGYVSDSQILGQTGTRRSGNWKIRVPDKQFDAFLEAVMELGIPENRRQQAQEVTEEFVDLQSRIASTKKVKERILKLMDQRSGSLQEIFTLQNELNRVDTQIDQMQGRLDLLTERVTLTTITLAIREEQNYVPPQTPDYSDRLAASWHGSLDSLAKTGQNVSIYAATVAPWVGVWTVALIPVGLIARRQWRKYWPRSTVLAEK